MTSYRNFVDDFPQRCQDVLKLAWGSACSEGREVTLMIMVASTGLIVPFERLRPDDINHQPHPSGDNKLFIQAASKLSELLDGNFLDSPLWGHEPKSWKSGEMKSVNGDPDSWPELEAAKPINDKKTVKRVLKIIRNALAHGNLFTRHNPIGELIFLEVTASEEGKISKASFVKVSPEDFRLFLEKWFHFLKHSHIAQDLVYQVLQGVA